MTTLRAGAALVDITPPMGTQIAGDIGRLRPVDEIRDPLFAHAIVIETDDKKICLICFDLTIVNTFYATQIREAVCEQHGFEFGAVMVCATQSHSAIALGHAFTLYESPYVPDDLRWLLGGDDAYHPLAVEGALQAVEKAMANLQPVSIGAASGIEARVAFNRRFVMRDGGAQTHPPTADPKIRHVEGPIDPEEGVLCFRGEDRKVIAALLHYTCHPNHGYPLNYISADWPGAWCDGAREIFGKQCVPLVLNGCCGNIHHTNHLDPHQIEDYRVMGEKLTETTREIAERIEYVAEGILDWRTQVLPLPWRKLDPEVFQNAHDLLKKHPTPQWLNDEHTRVSWGWVYAISLVDLEKQMQNERHFEYEMQAFRIGDVGIVALPGEPFVEAQLRLKIESPAYPTYVAHMANRYAGYIPTPEALKRGGYETNPGNWSKLAPEALDLIIDKAGRLLRELFAD